ncbi:putative serine/threonine-kinase pknA domain protein [Mycobacterium xenopi 3993]|nr:putative serine/threonine-kinase pknA domain protein [Mycobacterium xenopi 3993]
MTVAMKHIKEPPPPLPNDVPPNVRELIEITLVKNPQLRYKSGGPFADAVAAVRAGAATATEPNRAGHPGAIPSSAPSRVAANPTGRVPPPAEHARRPPGTARRRRDARSPPGSGHCCGRLECSGRWRSSSRC